MTANDEPDQIPAERLPDDAGRSGLMEGFRDRCGQQITEALPVLEQRLGDWVRRLCASDLLPFISDRVEHEE